jgi:hypothetical protein
VNKVSLLVAVSSVLAIWALSRNIDSDPSQQPAGTPLPRESGGRSLLPSWDAIQHGNTTPALDKDDTALGIFRESIVPRDTKNLSLPTGDERLENEPVDAEWALGMESLMWSTISTIGEVLEVECRTTICRTAVVQSDSEWTISQDRVLGDSFQSIIGSSDGRLDRVRLGFFGTADGRSGITIELSGPPLTAVATESP